MKCPRCAAACAPGSVACTYCNAPLASADALGDAARALDARFDALGAAVSTGIASLTAARAVAVPGPAGADPVARLRDALDAQARALPPPGTAQEALVWLRRAPTMAWVSYRAHGLVRSFALFGMPTLRALQGDARPQSPWDVCTLRGPLRRKGGRMEFLRARLHRDADGSLSAEVLANQSSGAATAFAWGDALVVLDAALDDIPEGTRLPCIRLESL